ncbi:hypothetical protein SASPL_121723 [Salvia splendens]|uniref:NAC domain-containing protein n=1 Tax=Salvia splendens TaxID=180675 RepID=A0A8X8ZWU1_SALSN|nr:hypothetical protein SASPL_121723 [Salvia splendens]
MLVKGFEFNPSGEDLINFYLYPWVKQKELPWNGIPVKEIYGPSSDPWVVFFDVESRWLIRPYVGSIKYTIYAFTFLSRVSNSKRVSRRAGTGTWGGQTGPKMIQDSENGQIIGQSKMLAFEHRSSDADFGHWTMHEYSLSDDLIRSSGVPNAADVVVCKITKTLIRDLQAENSCRTGSDIPAGQQPMTDTNELTWRLLVENGDIDIAGEHAQLHGNGSDSVLVRPPQITHHPAAGDGSDDPSFHPTDISFPVGPVASKKRAAEVHHPNEEDREGVLKRQKKLMPEHDLMDDAEEDEEEPSFATKLARLLLAVNGMKPL